MLPFGLPLTAEGLLQLPATKTIRRHLSDMRGYYADADAYAARLAAEDSLIYTFWETEYTGDTRGLSFGITEIVPGTVGREFHMTKGHFHASDGDEIYLTLKGRGKLLLQTRQGEARTYDMTPGGICYIPTGWGHRTVNVGAEPFIFVSIWPPHIVHDYESVQKYGFPQLMLQGDSGPVEAPNPRYQAG